MAHSRTIIAVCTGNICRSPMAEGFLRKHLQPRDDFQILSAGTHGCDGSAATPEAVVAARERGVDIGTHVARSITSVLAAEADLIVTMTAAHAAWLESRFPDCGQKVMTLGELAGRPDQDVEDPIGGTQAMYRQTAAQIEALIIAAKPAILDKTT